MTGSSISGSGKGGGSTTILSSLVGSGGGARLVVGMASVDQPQASEQRLAAACGALEELRLHRLAGAEAVDGGEFVEHVAGGH